MEEIFLSDERRQRYARQIMIPEIGEAGQKKLAAARVLVIGAGGLGSPAAMYLAAAGVGVIGIADGDTAELSNLQRQVIHSEKSLGKNKAESAAEFIGRLDPNVRVHIIADFLDEEGLRKIIGGYDFVLDCVDRPDVKLMINDVCADVGKPFCHGGVRNFGGQVMTWLPGFLNLREVMGEGFGADNGNKGIIGMACGICGSIQALEAVKFITGAGRLLTGKIFVFDGLNLKFGVLGDEK